MRSPAAPAALLALTALSGCLAATQPLAPAPAGDGILETPVWDATGNFSRVLRKGALDVLPVEPLPMTSFDGTTIATAVWRPAVPEGEKVPVILLVTPYLSSGVAAEDLWDRDFWIDNFVRHGYAWAHVAVRGTSDSEGCMETFGPNEQRDIDAVITHYGAQPWSNGNVAIAGVSYDGTTPWIGASFGNPHLRTIVPISGLTDVAGLEFRNGTAEIRAPLVSLLYWGLTGLTLRTDPSTAPGWACEDAVRGHAAYPTTAVTGHRGPGSPFADYWETRDWRQRVMDNYRGSVYLVHGLQDWNVEATMAFPFVTELQRQGTPVRMMLGQWSHDLPDGGYRKDHVRWDWAEQLLRWFDRELKGLPVEGGPAVDVEDNYGLWRTEATWPPADAAPLELHLGADGLAREPTAEGRALAAQPLGAMDTARRVVSDVVGIGLGRGPTDWRFSTGPLAEDLRFAGLAQLHVTVRPLSPAGGRLYAELLDVAPFGRATLVAHGVMDLRYHDGGQEPRQLTAGQPVLALMELFPADVLIPAGHALVLRIVPDATRPWDDWMGSPAGGAMELQWGGGSSLLRLPSITRDVGDGRYPGQPVHDP